MVQTVRDVMTHSPLALQDGTTLDVAAKAMRDNDVGNVLVLHNGGVSAIVTDRDITIRAVAEGRDPGRTVLKEICSKKLISLSPGDSVDEAIKLMSKHAVRRLPVVESGQPVGIVSLGDLAQNRDPRSVLGRISSARPNR